MTAMPAPARARNPWYTAVVTGMASYLDSATIVSSAAAWVIYAGAGMDVSDNQIGVLSFALTLGIAIGAISGGRLGDRFGRKPVFSVTMIAIVASMILNVFAPSFAFLLVAAVVAGLATGADLPVSISTIAEFADDKNRGKLVGFSQVLWMLGVVATLALQSIVGNMGHLGGQILFGHIAVVAAIVMVLRLSLPESPVWLKAQEERSSGIHTERAEHVSVRDLLKAPYLVPFVALAVFYPLVNLAANTGGQFGTFLWVKTAGATPAFAGQIGLLMWAFGLALAALFLRVVDTSWRMPAFYVGAASYVASTLVPALIGVNVTTLVVWQILGAIGGAFAFEAILKVWSQESFPTLLRSTAQGTIIGIARVMAAVLALVTPALANAGAQILFGVLTVLIAIGMAAAIGAFRHGSRNEFSLEDQVVEEGGYVHTTGH